MKKQFAVLLIVATGLWGCGDGTTERYTGYVEGDFVRPAPIAAGRLVSLMVTRGQTVEAGAVLFALDADRETAERDLAAASLTQAEAQLANLEIGRRPEEIAQIKAQKRQAESRQVLASQTLKRQKDLLAGKVVSVERVDQAQAEFNTATAAVRELDAALKVAALPARKDEIAAAKSAVAIASARLREAEWQLKERQVTAASAAIVQDVFFQPGEFVPASTPVLSLLPPANLFIKFYVPEDRLATLSIGQTVRLTCDSCGDPIAAKIRFVSREAEFTPPVIYAEKTRAKLMFRVEAVPDVSTKLHPGLPVDIEVTPETES